jgi:GNAT superfamily N-acetyltransferase
VGAVATHPAASPGALERLGPEHDCSQFRSREPALDEWLRKRALPAQGRTARTYVCCRGRRVVAFYAIANGGVQRAVATPKLRRNAPDPIPVMVLGRLAVDVEFERRGFGSALLRDAILRTLNASEIVGVAAILVHAISDAAKEFYLERGFAASPIEPMTLMLGLNEVEAALTGRPASS